jgi:hypothetical protein
MNDEPNLSKWQVTDKPAISETLQDNSALLPSQFIEASVGKEGYNSTWVNNQLRVQIDLLAKYPEVKSKIELYEMLPYSIRTFSRRRQRVSITDYTDDFQQKIDEILEARLVKSGYSAKNWPFIIFLLKNNHGYTDERQITNDTNVTFNVTRGINEPKQRKKIKLTSVKHRS